MTTNSLWKNPNVARWYWVDTTWACGVLGVNEEGTILESSNIFWRWKGRPFASIRARLTNHQRIKGGTKEVEDLFHDDRTQP